MEVQHVKNVVMVVLASAPRKISDLRTTVWSFKGPQTCMIHFRGSVCDEPLQEITVLSAPQLCPCARLKVPFALSEVSYLGCSMSEQLQLSHVVRTHAPLS